MTVVVPAARRADHLRRALASMRDTDIELEVVVVDLLADGQVSAVLESAPSPAVVRLLECRPSARGALRVGEARNIGAAAASSDLLCFLDLDCVVAPGSLDRWCDAAGTYRNALLAPPVRHLRPGWLGDVAPDDTIGSSSWLRASDALARPVPEADRVATHPEFDLFWSLAFCCSTTTFERVGGFDTTFVGYGAEDTDFARRARRRRVPLVWLSDGMAFHQHHPPSRLDADNVAELVANARRFRDRWGDWPMAGWFDDLAEQGLVEWDESADLLQVAGVSDVAEP
jgi:GT2 family glycosyltransferase